MENARRPPSLPLSPSPRRRLSVVPSSKADSAAVLLSSGKGKNPRSSSALLAARLNTTPTMTTATGSSSHSSSSHSSSSHSSSHEHRLNDSGSTPLRENNCAPLSAEAWRSPPHRQLLDPNAFKSDDIFLRSPKLRMNNSSTSSPRTASPRTASSAATSSLACGPVFSSRASDLMTMMMPAAAASSPVRNSLYSSFENCAGLNSSIGGVSGAAITSPSTTVVAAFRATVAALESDLAASRECEASLRAEVAEMTELLNDAGEAIVEAEDMRQTLDGYRIKLRAMEELQERIQVLELQHDLDRAAIAEYAEALEDVVDSFPDDDCEFLKPQDNGSILNSVLANELASKSVDSSMSAVTDSFSDSANAPISQKTRLFLENIFDEKRFSVKAKFTCALQKNFTASTFEACSPNPVLPSTVQSGTEVKKSTTETENCSASISKDSNCTSETISLTNDPTKNFELDLNNEIFDEIPAIELRDALRWSFKKIFEILSSVECAKVKADHDCLEN